MVCLSSLEQNELSLGCVLENYGETSTLHQQNPYYQWRNYRGITSFGRCRGLGRTWHLETPCIGCHSGAAKSKSRLAACHWCKRRRTTPRLYACTGLPVAKGGWRFWRDRCIITVLWLTWGRPISGSSFFHDAKPVTPNNSHELHGHQRRQDALLHHLNQTKSNMTEVSKKN